MMRVLLCNWKNKKGTANRTCSCGSWKQYWMNFSEMLWSKYCSVNNCFNRAVLGGHVIHDGSKKEYIIPMFEACNKLNDAFAIKVDTIRVPANVSETCGR